MGIMNKTTKEPETGYEGYGPWADGVPWVSFCPSDEGDTKRFRAGRYDDIDDIMYNDDIFINNNDDYFESYNDDYDKNGND